jgi:hypothetical protein
MYDTNNDGHLHLERIGKDEVVLRSMPSRVDTERIDSSVSNRIDTSLSSRPIEAGFGQGKTERENIVVNKAGKDGENAHEEDYVLNKDHN